MLQNGTDQTRVDWVDVAKGVCIILVVMMHSTLGVEKAVGETGWMGLIVEWARPFRMPDFFLIAGLFLPRIIDRGWIDFLDRKVLHFVYFYVIWVTIQFGFKAQNIAADAGWEGAVDAYLLAFVQPFGTLWFIYVLPIFFVATKLLRRVPAALVWTVAAGLEIANIETGYLVIDESASRFVYFYTGYLLAPHIFRFAAWAAEYARTAITGLVLWVPFNGIMMAWGFGDLPFASLALGFLGAAALVAFAAVIAQTAGATPLRFCGENSLVIYLGFFLPMATTRIALIQFGFVSDVGTMSLIVTIAGVLGALVMWQIARETPLRILYERPDAARLVPLWKRGMQPAE